MSANEKHQNALIIGGFILISTPGVSPMLFSEKTLVLRDTFFEFRFLYDFARENLLNGIIPLWNPYSNCGQPFIANPQSAFFYPLNWIYYLLDFHPASTLFIFIHLLLAGTFMYAFIKPIVKSSRLSFFGGLVYMLNGLLVSRIEFLSEFASLAWLPAILALLRITVLTPSWLSSVLLGLAIAIQFFSGHTPSFYYTALFGFIFMVFIFWAHYPKKQKAPAVLHAMKFLIAAGVLALLLVMIQLAPTYELFTQSLRSQTGYDVKTHLSPAIAGKMIEALRPTPSRSLADFRSMVATISGTSILSDANLIAKLGRTVWFNTFFLIIICVILWRRFCGKMTENYLVAGVIFLTAVDLLGNAAIFKCKIHAPIQEQLPEKKWSP